MVTLDEENKTVLTKEITYKAFAGAKRFRRRMIINRAYETTLLQNGIPTNIIDKRFGVSDKFYDVKEFENTLGGRKK